MQVQKKNKFRFIFKINILTPIAKKEQKRYKIAGINGLSGFH
jgi:hypothetical protein